MQKASVHNFTVSGLMCLLQKLKQMGLKKNSLPFFFGATSPFERKIPKTLILDLEENSAAS